MQLSLTEHAHRWLAARLHAGAWAVDATAGNGHDTLFLARLAGPRGRVYAFDIDPQALAAAERRLRGEADLAPVAFVLASHAEMRRHLPLEAAGRLAAVAFNLGYLPGGDHGRTTLAASTLAALEEAWALLAPGGALSILAYPGHPEGALEFQAVDVWAAAKGIAERRQGPPGRRPSPVWLGLERPAR